MRAAGADALAGDPGIRVGLADADEAFVGVDLDDQVVLGRRAGRRS